MKQFTMKMNDDYQRPVVNLQKWHHFNAMIDSGALLPVWIDSEELLMATGATLIRNKINFGGIGGMVTGKMYQIPDFVLGELVYPNMHILCYPMKMSRCQILISSTMFDHLRCELDYENRAVNVTVPDKESTIRNLRILDRDGHLVVLCESA